MEKGNGGLHYSWKKIWRAAETVKKRGIQFPRKKMREDVVEVDIVCRMLYYRMLRGIGVLARLAREEKRRNYFQRQGFFVSFGGGYEPCNVF